MGGESASVLRQYALIMWHLSSAADHMAALRAGEAERQRRMGSFRAELRRIVGADFDITVTINGGCVEAVIEDLRFAAFEYAGPDDSDPVVMATLLGRCPRCGLETPSEPIQDLAELGKLLERFVPIFTHPCHAILKHQSETQPIK